jgi:hypothetical protein
LQPLEAKLDLSNYYNKAQVYTKQEVNVLIAALEEELQSANENLDRKVESVTGEFVDNTDSKNPVIGGIQGALDLKVGKIPFSDMVFLSDGVSSVYCSKDMKTWDSYPFADSSNNAGRTQLIGDNQLFFSTTISGGTFNVFDDLNDLTNVRKASAGFGVGYGGTFEPVTKKYFFFRSNLTSGGMVYSDDNLVTFHGETNLLPAGNIAWAIAGGNGLILVLAINTTASTTNWYLYDAASLSVISQGVFQKLLTTHLRCAIMCNLSPQAAGSEH